MQDCLAKIGPDGSTSAPICQSNLDCDPDPKRECTLRNPEHCSTCQKTKPDDVNGTCVCRGATRCSLCTKGTHYKLDGKCETCPENPALLITLLVVAVFCAMIGGYFLGQKNFNMAFLSIGYDYVSVLALFAGSDIKWPSWMLRLFQILSIFNFNVDVTAPECLVPDLAFDKKWAAMMCLPLIIAAVFIVLWLGKLLFKLICKRKKKWRELNTHSSKLIATFTLLYYYMYTGLTRSALRIFKCEPVTPDDGFKYTDFTDLSCEGGLCRCDEGLQAQLQGPAILGLIFYTIGYPLFILIILKTYKNKIKEDQLLRAAGIGDDRKTTTSSEVYSVRKRWHKLYYHFKPGKTYWIFIIVMRKMWIAIAGLMFRGSPGFQLAVVLMILFASYVLQVQHRPYMSTAERDLVLEEHRRKASEGDPDHLRIQPVMAMAIERQRLVENALKIKKKKMQLKQTFSGKSLVGFDESKNKKMKYFWDYNTIEATLLACGIVVCLSGVMFESGRFDGRPDLQWYVSVVFHFFVVFDFLIFIFCVLLNDDKNHANSEKWGNVH